MNNPVRLTVGIFLLATSALSATTRYVWQSSPGPAPPYTNWTTAAHVIQDAVDAAQTGDEIVVTNGIYATGGRAVGTNVLVNRVAVDKPLTVRSINGPHFTVIQGYQVPGTTNGDGAIRCVYLTNDARLSGFTLTKGATRSVSDDWPYPERSGGGLWSASTTAVISNCVVATNSASNVGGGTYKGMLNKCTLTANSATWGGGAGTDYGSSDTLTLNDCTLSANSAIWGAGAYEGTLNNCTLTANLAGGGGAACYGTLNNCALVGNSSADWGGGAFESVLNNCTLTGNATRNFGGGAADDNHGNLKLNNCIVYFNQAPNGANVCGGTLNYCCTTPLPSGGTGNIALDPQLASASHLSASSPCRGAGNTNYVSGTDIDGEAWASPPKAPGLPCRMVQLTPSSSEDQPKLRLLPAACCTGTSRAVPEITTVKRSGCDRFRCLRGDR